VPLAGRSTGQRKLAFATVGDYPLCVIQNSPGAGRIVVYSPPMRANVTGFRSTRIFPLIFDYPPGGIYILHTNWTDGTGFVREYYDGTLPTKDQADSVVFNLNKQFPFVTSPTYGGVLFNFSYRAFFNRTV
jgi:hypothetical protein